MSSGKSEMNLSVINFLGMIIFEQPIHYWAVAVVTVKLIEQVFLPLYALKVAICACGEWKVFNCKVYSWAWLKF